MKGETLPCLWVKVACHNQYIFHANTVQIFLFAKITPQAYPSNS